MSLPHPVNLSSLAAALLARVREELPAAFVPARPIRLSRAPQSLEVMGGSADYTGSLVLGTALDRGAAVALQERDDREVQVFSFNLFDDHAPFTLRISLDALAAATAEELRRGFREPGREWAGGVVGCLFELHRRGLVDLRDPRVRGVNLALYSSSPLQAGGSSAPLVVATMTNLREHFGLGGRIDAIGLAEMSCAAETQIAGAGGGIAAAFVGASAQPGTLVRLLCQPHQPQPPLILPDSVRVLGLSLPSLETLDDLTYRRTRCAAFMGHRILLEKMRQIGIRAGRALQGDPMGGYLANLDRDDYYRFFSTTLLEKIKGGDFLLRYGGTIDPATKVEPDHRYRVREVTEYHILEVWWARHFTKRLEVAAAVQAANHPALGRMAGQLMYESHDAAASRQLLPTAACAAVNAIRDLGSPAIYGARVSAYGSGGMVALLTATDARADAAIAEVLTAYRTRTGRTAEAIPCGNSGSTTLITH